MEMLEIQNLTYVYSKGTPFEHLALDEINLHIKQGETLAIIGHTGSGKSTLIGHLNGLLKAQSGVVLFSGKDIWADKKELKNIRFKIGLCFQYPEYQLFEETVYKDIAFGPKNMGLDEAEIDRRVRQSLAYMGLEEKYLERSPFDLSGGQKRKIALAGILAMEPDILVLDEPTAGLDPAARNNLFGLIENYKKKSGTTVVFVSHSMEDVANLADRIVVMDHGKIAMEGEPDTIFERAEELLDMGLSVPAITTIFLKLNQKGYNLQPVYRVDDAVRVLQSVMGGVVADA
ncbi:MAG: energy-coupling factor transporter ATPase [Clostridia bacterium]|nr:energy-coupling factor transporter ATPase [Clostridia bacterium]